MKQDTYLYSNKNVPDRLEAEEGQDPVSQKELIQPKPEFSCHIREETHATRTTSLPALDSFSNQDIKRSIGGELD